MIIGTIVGVLFVLILLDDYTTTEIFNATRMGEVLPKKEKGDL